MTKSPLRETTGIPLAHRGWDDWLTRLDNAPHQVPDRPWVAARNLPAEAESPKIARHVTKTTLAEWSLARFYDDASVVVSELVTNAIRHGLRCGVDAEEALRLVLVRYRCHLVCMVTDPADRAPSMREPDYVAESGRGLHIIDAISRAWGWTPLLGGGKAVWAAFSIA
ncbi:ATP-binding protein [Actinoallomurus liliacearum]